MASIDGFISRITHTLTGAFLFAYAIAPYTWTSAPKLSYGWLAPVAAALSVLSGLYNASKAKPKEFARPAKYRWAVYGKLPFIVAFTPVFASYIGDEKAALVRVGVAVLMFIMGARARFIREAETLRVPGKSY